MLNAVYHDKPLIIIGVTFWEKLVSHHRAVNHNFLGIYIFITPIQVVLILTGVNSALCCERQSELYRDRQIS